MGGGELRVLAIILAVSLFWFGINSSWESLPLLCEISHLIGFIMFTDTFGFVPTYYSVISILHLFGFFQI